MKTFNIDFGTEITDKQIKNKIEYIIRQFNEADNLQNASGFGDTSEATWKNKLLEECPYYFDLEDVWSKMHGELEQEPIDSLADLDFSLVEAPPHPPHQPSPDWSDIDDDSDNNNNSHEPVREEEEVLEEEEEDEEEPLIRMHRLPVVSGNGKQPVNSTTKPTQRQKAQGLSTQGQQKQTLASVRQQQDRRGSSTTPAMAPSDDTTEPPTKAKALSITDALERFTEVLLSQVTLQSAESKYKQDLSLKQQELDYNLSLKKMEFEHELRKMELTRDMDLKKQVHEREMMTLHLTALGHAKDSQMPRVIILDDKIPRYLPQRTDPEPDSCRYLSEVASSPEPITKTPPGSPNKCPTISKDNAQGQDSTKS